MKRVWKLATTVENEKCQIGDGDDEEEKEDGVDDGEDDEEEDDEEYKEEEDVWKGWRLTGWWPV